MSRPMRALQQLNLWKATPVLALTIAAALLLAGLLTAFYTEHAYIEQRTREATVQGQILASTVSAALAFDDPAAAREYVGALRANPEVLQAAVYDAGGALFASFSRAGETPPARLPAGPPVLVGDDRLTVTTPVIQGDTPLGSVWLRVLTDPPARRIGRFALIALLATMVAVVVAVLGIAHATLSRANANLQRQSAELAASNARLVQQIDEARAVRSGLAISSKLLSLAVSVRPAP